LDYKGLFRTEHDVFMKLRALEAGFWCMEVFHWVFGYQSAC